MPESQEWQNQFVVMADSWIKLVGIMPFSITTKGKVMIGAWYEPSSVLMIDAFTPGGAPLITNGGKGLGMVYPPDVAQAPPEWFKYHEAIEDLCQIEKP